MRWTTLAFIGALDVVLAITLTFFDSRSDDGSVIITVLAVLWLLPLLVGAWNMVKFWLAYHLFLKKRLVRVFKAEMHRTKFPGSGAFYDHMTYLSHVMDEEDVPMAARLKAAFIVGELATYKIERPFSLGIACEMAFKQAMDEYQALPSTSGLFTRT